MEIESEIIIESKKKRSKNNQGKIPVSDAVLVIATEPPEKGCD